MSTAAKMIITRDPVESLRLQLELQAEVARAVTAEAADLETLLMPAAEAVATTLDADVVAIWTTEADTGELCLEVTTRSDAGPVPRPRVAIGEAYMTALSTVARPSAFIDPPFEQPLFTVGLSGSRRGTSVCPLVLDGNRLVGVLAMMRSVALQSGEEQAFASVADQLALAIDKDRALRGLREREDGLDILIRTAPDGIVVMDANSRIIATNPSLDQIFGYEANELVGQEVTVLMPERLRGRHTAGVRRYQETGEKRISWHGAELVGQRKDGAEFPIEISFGQYGQEGRKVFTGFIRDITDRKRAEQRERRRRRLIQTAAVYLGSSWVALEAGDLLIPLLPFPDWAFRALVLIGLLGFPVALALAWMFEFSKSGIRRATALPAAPRSSPHCTSVRVARTGIGAVMLGALFLVPVMLGPLARRVDRAQPEISIAVLPFEDVSGSEGRTPLGITDEVLTQIASLPGVRATSRTSVRAAMANPKPLAQIGRDLDVSFVLEGSVRRQGDRMRITVQLIRTVSDESVWSASYNHDATDLLSAEEKIAADIAVSAHRTMFQSPD